MKLVCSVFDLKAKLWSTPFYSHSSVTAVRDFATAARSNDGIGLYPEDYELYSLCSWDEVSGKFVDHEPRFLARGDDFVKKEV